MYVYNRFVMSAPLATQSEAVNEKVSERRKKKKCTHKSNTKTTHISCFHVIKLFLPIFHVTFMKY